MDAREDGGAVPVTRRGGPPAKGRPSEDRASSTNTAVRVTPGGDNRAQAYIAAMNGRVPPRHPVIYLAARPELRKRPAWPKLLHVVQRELPGVELASYGTTFASGQDHKARIAQVIGDSAGLVVIPNAKGYIGPGIGREIRLAMAAKLPVVVLNRRGLAALADCRIEQLPEADRRPWYEARIVLPPPGRPSEALRASLRAMGARRAPAGALRRRP